MKRVAVVGAGIAGLGAAHHLMPHAAVTLFEAGGELGGHAHTVDVTLPGPNGPITHGVDTGFLVFNERTYPQFIALMSELGVKTAPSDMSFSVQAAALGLEWSGTNLATVFAQKRNLIRPGHWRMLWDILRFNRECTAMAASGEDKFLRVPIGDYLEHGQFSRDFTEGYLLPMIGCIWSCPTEQMLRFPMATLVRFCHNHGLLQVSDRPQWMTIEGGSRQYVQAIARGLSDVRVNTPVLRVIPTGSGGAPGVSVLTAAGTETFDEVVLACHAPQSLAMLEDPHPTQIRVLKPIRYQANRAVLHLDESVLPHRKAAWAAWNYERAADVPQEKAQVCLHYLINRLQPLPFMQSVIVSLNPARAIKPSAVLAEIDYEHPIFDQAAVDAQGALPQAQGHGHVWLCGAWAKYGFHEDGLSSGANVAHRIKSAWGLTSTPSEQSKSSPASAALDGREYAV